MQYNVNYDPSELPLEIQKINQWNHSRTTENIKKPVYWHYASNGGLTFEDALTKVKQSDRRIVMGFYVTKKDQYILGDVDEINDPNNPFPDIPPNLAYLLKTKKTYSEISPSGKGIRFFLKFESSDEKQKLSGKVYHTNEECDWRKPEDTQINIGPPWMTMTLNPTSFSSNEIATVTIEELQKCFAVKLKENYNNVIPISKKKSPFSTSEKTNIVREQSVPSFGNMEAALNMIQLDQNPRIKRSYKKVFKENYQHYEYWLKVMMAMHDYSQHTTDEVKCLELIVAWSRKDEVAFKDEQDVINYWNGLAERIANVDGPKITFRTLLSLAYYNTIHWPFAHKPKDKNIPELPRPIISEYANFETLLDFYDIKFHINELEPSSFFISGDEDIMQKWFLIAAVEKHFGELYGPYSRELLIPVLHMFVQAHDFRGIDHRRVKEFMINATVSTTLSVNLLKRYIETPFEMLPDDYKDNPENYNTSSVDLLFNSITIDYMTSDTKKERALYYRYYRCWLMGVIRQLYYEGEFDLNNCILILSSIEKKQKTTHFLKMFPKRFRKYITLTTHGFSTETNKRDLSKLAAESLLMIWNEIEQHLNPEVESAFKEIIDNTPVKFIDKWDKTKTTTTPIAIYGGTSNQKSFKLSDNGSRRMFIIPVLNVDTDAVVNICWHPIFQELIKEFKDSLKKKILPWNLTEDELSYQARLHGGLKSKNNIDLALEDTYDATAVLQVKHKNIIGVKSFQRDNTGTFKTTKQIQSDLDFHGINSAKIPRSALEKALIRLCSRYSDTERNEREFWNPKCKIKNGLAIWKGRKLWCTPPLIEPYKEDDGLGDEFG